MNSSTPSTPAPNNPTPSNPVVMQIIPVLGPGGAEQGCIDVGIEIKKSGAVSIIVSNGGHRVHECQRHGIEHINLPVHSKNPFVMWGNIKKIRNLIHKNKVDIVHVRSRAPAWSAYFACKKTNAYFMTTCHAAYTLNGRFKKFYNSIMAKGKRVISISNFISDYLIKNYDVNPQNIRLVHRGIALEKFHPAYIKPAQIIKITQSWRLPDDADIVMMPGRLSRIKGHDTLIEAMALLNRKDLYCVFIGSDQGRTKYREELLQKIEDKSLGNNVRIIDHTDDIAAAYMCSTVIVSASIVPEGFGRVPVEAQAMGRPIVATDHGGATETIIAGETGWLVPPENPKAMAKAIQEALSLTNEAREIMAQKSINHISTYFSREKMLDETLNVYAELMNEKWQYGTNKY